MRRNTVSLACSVLLAFLLSLRLTLGTATAGPSSALPSGSPNAAATPSSCTAPESIEPIEAFAYPIDDSRTLALIDFVENIQAGDRSAVAKRAAVPQPEAEAEEFERALRGQCISTQIAYRAVRLEYGVAKRWSANDLRDIESAAKFAMAALLLGERVTARTRDATLAVFGTSSAQLDARLAARLIALAAPADATTTRCTGTIDATAPRAEQPSYPLEAISHRESGLIRVKVALDAHGYVRSATIFRADIHPSDSPGSSLIAAAVVAAGTSGYTPEFRSCQPIAGNYIFRADFVGIN